MRRIPVDYFERKRVDVFGIIDQAFLQKGGNLLHGVFRNVGREIMLWVAPALEVRYNVGFVHIRNRRDQAGEAGGMGAGRIGPLRALVVPAVTFRAAPGLRAGARVAGLAVPDGHIALRRVRSQRGVPLIIQLRSFDQIGARSWHSACQCKTRPEEHQDEQRTRD